MSIPAAAPSDEHCYLSSSDLLSCRFYDKERAAFQIHHTNIRPGDGRTRFSTSMSELFPVHNAGKVMQRQHADLC